MERENKKRGRGGGEAAAAKKYCVEKTAKKQEINNNNIDLEDKDGLTTWEAYMPAVGVFDFPWLKESMIPKSAELKLEDTFSYWVDDICGTAGAEFSGQGEGLCQTPALSDLSKEKLEVEENVWAWEGDGLDCIWSSLLNQPLWTGFY